MVPTLIMVPRAEGPTSNTRGIDHTEQTSTVPSEGKDNSPLMALAVKELESLRNRGVDVHFPKACWAVVKQLPGNRMCLDCGTGYPEWACVSFGGLLCLQCSGRHRGLGVRTSFVKSMHMDHWSHSQILQMLEGGNRQLSCFFLRHSLHDTNTRYLTKAAAFYRHHLSKHVHTLVNTIGPYQGREASRRLGKSKKKLVKTITNKELHRTQISQQKPRLCSNAMGTNG